MRVRGDQWIAPTHVGHLDSIAKMKRLQVNSEEDRSGEIDRDAFDLFLCFPPTILHARYAPQIPIGRLMKKIQRQPNRCRSRNRPRSVRLRSPREMPWRQSPIALPRWLAGKATEAIALPLAGDHRATHRL